MLDQLTASGGLEIQLLNIIKLHSVWRRILLLVIFGGVSLAVGCADSTRPQATGKGFIRGINASVTSPELIFMIEERSIGGVQYKRVSGFNEYDDLTYNFNFDVVLPGDTEPNRLAGRNIDVIVDTEYTLVLTGSIANPSILQWESPQRVWAGTETVYEADFAHLSAQLGQVDVYLEQSGTAPVLGNEVGTFSFGDRVPYIEFPDGSYVLTVTAPDDPSTVLFQSQPLASTPATRVTFAIFDPDPSITAAVAVNLISAGGSSTSLGDINSPPEIRLLHTAFGTQNVDAYLAGDMANVIFPDVGFGELSAYADFPGNAALLTTTEVGDATTVVFEETVGITQNARTTVLLRGDPATLGYSVLLNDARPLSTFGVVRIANMSVNHDFLDVYSQEPGTAIDSAVRPRWSFLTSLLDTGFYAVTNGMHELTMTVSGEKTVLSAPIVIDVSASDIVDIVILDTADANTVEVRVFDSM